MTTVFFGLRCIMIHAPSEAQHAGGLSRCSSWSNLTRRIKSTRRGRVGVGARGTRVRAEAYLVRASRSAKILAWSSGVLVGEGVRVQRKAGIEGVWSEPSWTGICHIEGSDAGVSDRSHES